MLQPKEIADGVRVLVLPDTRFKTARLTVALFLPLCEETASAQALLPSVLARGCRAYPDFSALQLRLSELYGADVVAGVRRVGEHQVLTLTAVSIEDRFALNGESVTQACASLLRDMLFDPALEQGCFRDEDVRQEKHCLIQHIRSEINEKRIYARRQCERLLCGDEPYAVSHNGTEQGVAAVTPEMLTETWRRVLAQAQVLIVSQGSDTEGKAAHLLAEGFAASERRPIVLDTAVVRAAADEVKRQTERMDVKQAKLVMGFRTTVAEPSERIPAMRLFNALWGGCFSSRLFTHVREKLGLCYYCSSTFDRTKGIFLVDSGVQADKAPLAEAEILRQLQAIRDGAFTDEELENARRALINQYHEVTDTPSALMTWYIGQGGDARFVSPEQAAAEIAAVTREQVIEMAALVQLDCVYCLEGVANDG